MADEFANSCEVHLVKKLRATLVQKLTKMNFLLQEGHHIKLVRW